MRFIRHHNKRKTKLEIISVHIPKTAGRSFREILTQVYGPSLDERYKKEHFFKNDKEQVSIGKSIPKNLRGIHGHLTINQLKELINRYDPRVITWVRDPVERVISNYYFLMKRISLGIVNEKVKRKKDLTLIEYAEKPRNINRMSRTLSGLSIHDFFFIGIVERFEADVRELAEKMNWPGNLEIPHTNSNAGFKHSNVCATLFDEIDDTIKDRIAELNQDDMHLYKKIIKMRGISHIYEAR